MRELTLHLLSALMLITTLSCQSDRKDAQEQFRDRQQAILEREKGEDTELAIGGEEIAVIKDSPVVEEPLSQQPGSTAGDKVVGVKDGDTVVLLRNGEEVTVRLFGVDTPEKAQPYGQRAKQFTSDLAFGKQVRLLVHNKDRYGRTVGTIILPNGKSLNEELIKNGYAWHYKAYSNDKNLANAEADARRFKRGLWQDPNPVAPWDYRKEKRSKSNALEPAVAVTPVPKGATKRAVYLCDSSGSAVYHVDKSCSVLKRCKAEVLTVTEAAAIREFGRRLDKTCSKQ